MDHGQTKVTAKLARYFIIDLGTFIDFEQNKIRISTRQNWTDIWDKLDGVD